MGISIFGWKIRSNPGKWIRRQALGGEPITAGNLLDKALEILDYDSTGALLLDLFSGTITADEIKRKLTSDLRDRVMLEIQQATVKLRDVMEALSGVTPAR